METTPESSETLTGPLLLDSETGTEGGYWALQDERWTHVADEKVSWCDGGNDCPTSLREIEGKPDHYSPRGTGKRLTEVHWSYEGLYRLRTGDHLTVYGEPDPSVVVWEGTITLTHQSDQYAPDAVTASGWVIHDFPEGVNFSDWQDWFLGGLPAKVVRGG